MPPVSSTASSNFRSATAFRLNVFFRPIYVTKKYYAPMQQTPSHSSCSYIYTSTEERKPAHACFTATGIAAHTKPSQHQPHATLLSSQWLPPAAKPSCAQIRHFRQHCSTYKASTPLFPSTNTVYLQFNICLLPHLLPLPTSSSPPTYRCHLLMHRPQVS
jgi:hypothetical protein